MEFRYKSEPKEIIDKNRAIAAILRDFKDMTVDKIRMKVSINMLVRFNGFKKYAAKSMPMIKKIQITASGFLSTIK